MLAGDTACGYAVIQWGNLDTEGLDSGQSDLWFRHHT